MRFADRMGRVGPSAIRDLLRHGADPELISFGGGYPDPALFPAGELHGVYAELLSGDPAALQYCPSDGLPELREHVAARMRRDGMDCTAGDVLIIQGAQQGLDLAGKLMLNPGDTVVTENPTFLGALIAFNPFEPAYAPVRTDEDGMDMADLERVLSRSPRAKLLYTVPDFQNPTGITMSTPRRRRLIELANEHDLLVLEDTPYRELRYDGDSLPTLKSLDTEGRVVHLGSFSKILAPGMRLGWAVADPEVLDRLALLKLAADTQCSTLNMAAAARYLDRHDIDAHITAARAGYRAKRDLILEVLQKTFPDTVAFTTPRGGLFTWLTFPAGFDTAEFMRDVAVPRARVAYVPGATFFPTTPEHNHARFNFSGMSDDDIVAGITRLSTYLNW
ncbi:MAG TPA: PLP-dependent aminotransferase family protein [Actinophytocola sp.]|uniref:aminotransferase-like domain-containing protein n=1 Tax=Actinophytocola sp. TaxID=1872138 RepID=UPI002DBA8971|nr:PLP-dependent aminotransferase family protein [Actinophytocola sp.]HEU5471065.1 PLP-dependent aminotransferase family protein [Actinophytocola sp.]